MILDCIEPSNSLSSNILAEKSHKNVSEKQEIYAILKPGYIREKDGEEYDRCRQYIVDVLENTPYIYNVKVHERESYLSYFEFVFEFDYDFSTFSHVLRFFRTLFSIMDYLKREVIDVEHTHIYIRKNFEDPELEQTNYFNLAGPRSTMFVLETVAKDLFNVKRKSGTIGIELDYGYKLSTYAKEFDFDVRT